MADTNTASILERLHAINASLRQVHSAPALEQALVRELNQTLGYEVVILYVEDITKRYLKPVAAAWSGLNAKETKAFLAQLPLQELPLNPELIHPGKFWEDQSLILPTGYPAIRSTLGIALTVAGKRAGKIYVASVHDDCFNAQDRFALELIADTCGLLFHKFQLLDQQIAEQKISSTLQEISATLVSSLELDNTLSIILDSLEQLLTFDSAAIYLLAPNRRLRMVAGTGMPNEEVTMASAKETDRFELDEAVINGRKPIAVNDVRKDSRWKPLKGTEYIRSWLGVPLCYREKAIGLLTIDRSTINPFVAHQISLTESFSQQAAIAIENARLFSQVIAQQERMRKLSSKVVAAQEEERRRISRELHDEMGQALTAIKLNLQLIAGSISQSDDKLVSHIEETIDLTNASLQEVRRLAMDLRPSILDDLGLVPTLNWYKNQFNKRNPIKLELNIDPKLPRLSPETETALYRVTQEALTNVSRHAQAQKAEVKLELKNNQLLCVIIDDGQGFKQTANRPDTMGVGFTSMVERIEALNGQIDIQSKPGQGTRINIAIPALVALKNKQ